MPRLTRELRGDLSVTATVTFDVPDHATPDEIFAAALNAPRTWQDADGTPVSGDIDDIQLCEDD